MTVRRCLWRIEDRRQGLIIHLDEAESFTSKDVPHNRFGFTHQDQPILADEKVRFYVQSVTPAVDLQAYGLLH